MQINPQAGTWKAPEGYRLASVDERTLCHHKKIREFDNSYYLNRCTDVIYICDECKIFWRVDMSD